MPELNLKPHHLRLLRDLLAAHAPEAEVWAYGSRVSGRGHEGSDLDLVLRNPDRPDAPQPDLYLLRDALREAICPSSWTSSTGRESPSTFVAASSATTSSSRRRRRP